MSPLSDSDGRLMELRWFFADLHWERAYVSAGK